MAVNTVISLHEGLHAAAKVIEKDAKDRIGEYQAAAGPFNAWDGLADSTMAARELAGYPANEPLLVSGELRDSIEHEVAGLEAVVGSKLEKAAWQEFGTEQGGQRHIPPRPFIGPAAFENKEKIEGILGAASVRGLSKGGAIPSLHYDHELNNALSIK